MIISDLLKENFDLNEGENIEAIDEVYDYRYTNPKNNEIDVQIMVSVAAKTHQNGNSRNPENDIYPRVKFQVLDGDLKNGSKNKPVLCVRANPNFIHYYDGDISLYTQDQRKDIVRFVIVNYNILNQLWHSYNYIAKSKKDFEDEWFSKMIIDKKLLRSKCPNPPELVYFEEEGQTHKRYKE